MKSKNYIFYDGNYLAPGYLIANVQDGKIKKLLKIYNESDIGRPLFGIRAYSTDTNESLDNDYSSISFSFTDLDNTELYQCLDNLCTSLNGKTIFSIDPLRQGKNNLNLEKNSGLIKVILRKDTFNGTQHPTNYIDILLGDDYTCEAYSEFLKFYLELSKIETREFSSFEFEKMLLMK